MVGPFVTTGQGADGVLVKPDADSGLTQPLVNRNYMAPIFPFVGDVGCVGAGALSATPSKRWTPPYVPPFRIE